MSFMGELSDIGVADLLYLLALRRQSGKLAISANGDEVNLYLDRGQLTLVTSSNMTFRLGRMLVRLGFLDGDRLREALQIQEQFGRNQPLGALLLQHGYITDQQLSACVEEQCVEILTHVIAANGGIFVYHRGAAVPSGTVIVPLNADRIVLEATRRTDEVMTLRGLLPDEHAVIMLSDEIDDVAETLSDLEVSIAARLQWSSASIGEIAERLESDELTVWRTVISMRERGLVVTMQPKNQPSVMPLVRDAID